VSRRVSDIEQSKRKAVFSELKGYCIHAGDNNYMEVTQWTNGEGYDISIDARMVKRSQSDVW
jgi:hypothetical protein